MIRTGTFSCWIELANIHCAKYRLLKLSLVLLFKIDETLVSVSVVIAGLALSYAKTSSYEVTDAGTK